MTKEIYFRIPQPERPFSTARYAQRLTLAELTAETEASSLLSEQTKEQLRMLAEMIIVSVIDDYPDSVTKYLKGLYLTTARLVSNPNGPAPQNDPALPIHWEDYQD